MGTRVEFVPNGGGCGRIWRGVDNADVFAERRNRIARRKIIRAGESLGCERQKNYGDRQDDRRSKPSAVTSAAVQAALYTAVWAAPALRYRTHLTPLTHGTF